MPRRLPLALALTLPALTLGPASSALAAGKPGGAPPEKLTTVEGITEYQLKNGLRVLLFPDPSKPTVTVNITYFVGSRHEGYGETGMAHLLEHMLFKGTPKHANPWALLQQHGANFNGTTWNDRTNYYETLPATVENLEWALAFEADRMLHSNIAEADLKKEFSVVRNEFEMGENSPEAILEERMYQAAYVWHGYGRPTIGSRSDIERVPIANLRSFYQRFYQPDNALLVVAGKFDPQATLALIQKHYGPLPRPSRSLSPTHTVEPQQDGERQVLLRRSGDVSYVGVMYHGVAGADPAAPSSQALVDLLVDKPSGRLYRALVETGLAAEVMGEADSFTEPGMIKLFAKVAPGKAPGEVLAKLVELVEGIGKSEVTADEVKRFQRKFAKRFELAMTRSDAIGVMLSDWAALGDWRLWFINRDRVEGLTAATVRDVAARFLKRSNRTSGLFVPDPNPDRSPLVERPDVAPMVKDYQGRAAAAEGEAFQATVDNIEQRTQRSTLRNGAKLALLPKKTRGGSVKLLFSLNYGAEADFKDLDMAEDLLHGLLVRGTTSRSYAQLKDELDRLKIDLRVDGNQELPGTANVRVSTVRESLPAALPLIAEILRRPALAADQLEVTRKEVVTRLEASRQEPQDQAMSSLMRRLRPWPVGDVRHVLSTDEALAQARSAKREDLVRLHGLWGMDAAEVAAVGDFDVAALKQALEQHFGDWKASRPYQRITNPFKAPTSGAETIRLADKQMAFLAVAQAVELRDDEPDFPALRFFDFLLGGNADSRLLGRLRQKEGLSYGAFSMLRVSAEDRNGMLFAGAIAAPQNTPKALAILDEEYAKLLAEGPTTLELTKAKESWRQRFQTQLSQDDFVVSALARGLHLGRTMEFYKKLNQRVEALSGKEIATVAKKHLDPARLVKVSAGDLKP